MINYVLRSDMYYEQSRFDLIYIFCHMIAHVIIYATGHYVIRIEVVTMA